MADLALTEFRDNGLAGEKEGGVYPHVNLRKVHELGLLHIAPKIEHGGKDGLLPGKNPDLFVNLLRLIARGDGATGHCYQLHNHGLWSLELSASEEQVERFLKPLTSKYSIVAAVGSEPGRILQNDVRTTAKRVSGGWIVNGQKNYVTNGGNADLVIASVGIEGQTDAISRNFHILIDDSIDGITWEDDWFRPAGMRNARSPLLTLSDTFIPDSHVLGKPGDFIRQRQFAVYHLAFAANYLGGAEGLFDWYLGYIRQRGRADNELIQLRIGEIKVQLDSAAALFERAVEEWRKGWTPDAELISLSAKTLAARTGIEVGKTVLYTAGSTAQFEQFPFSYYLRNIQQHIVHVGHDVTAKTIGQAALGVKFDATRQR
ncbi:MAG TPA: acyl-CoA dehydrogenase family protein [Pseudolabrys sp.]|nr:acyl-CoA dehydrogenase family protein [Pseudolabrys sp.]